MIPLGAMLRALRVPLAWLAVLALGILAVGWPVAARHRAQRLHRGQHTGCGPGRLGTGQPIDLDGNPDHAILPLYTSYTCDDGTQTLWHKVQ